MTPREKELADRGWEKKSTNSEPRLTELVRAYRGIGCDVHLEPFDPGGQPGCRQCAKAAPKDLQTIFIRKAGSGKTDDDMDETPGTV